ncbi:MAG: hypothetical protein ACK41P_07875 [Asticcacaulis sp.]
MRKLKTALFATAALFAATSAMAQSTPAATDCSAGGRPLCEINPNINSTQVNGRLDVLSDVRVVVPTVEGKVDISSTAVGNNFSLDTKSDVGNINVGQNNQSDIVANLNVNIDTATSAVLNATAVANNTSLKFRSADNINNTQVAGTMPTPPAPNPPRIDPTARVNVAVGEINDTLDVNATAVVNNFAVEGKMANLNSNQSAFNQPVHALVNVSATKVGELKVAGTAVGNNISIKF